MAISPDQVTDMADQMQLVDTLFQRAMLGLQAYTNTRDPTAQQLASQSVRRSVGAMKSVLAETIGDLPRAYSEEEINALAGELSTLRATATRMTANLATAQTPLLVDEDGNVTQDYTQAQKDGIESEIARLHAKMGTVLAAATDKEPINPGLEEVEPAAPEE